MNLFVKMKKILLKIIKLIITTILGIEATENLQFLIRYIHYKLEKNLSNSFLKSNKKLDLIIFDDTFPNILSPFRIAEFNCYLEKFKNTGVYSTVIDYNYCKEEYIKFYPQFKDKVHQFKLNIDYNSSLYYIDFLHNTYYFLPIVEANKIPFVFTLYPGGHFGLHNKESDRKLRKICKSKFLRKIIVTQKVTYDYLIDNNFCNKSKIEFIYGGVLGSEYYKKNYIEKKYYKQNKDTFDICFVANKYMNKGIDKGYDTFIEVAKILSLYSEDIRFHVIGNFSPGDIDIKPIENRLTFYGVRKIEFFHKFYFNMDIICSPNIPFKLDTGYFDGFPTSCCVEAAFAGVAVFCSDELNLNIEFINNFDICIIPVEPKKIAKIILNYFNDLNSLYNLSQRCRDKFLKVFDIKVQMHKRQQVIQSCLKGEYNKTISDILND